MSALPLWANTPQARQLIAAILADPPHTTRHDACGFTVYQYAGKNARRLRDLFDDQLAAIMQAESDAWAAGKSFDELSKQADALLRSERPDALLARLLSEGESLAPVAWVSPTRVAA